ncbi:MAG: hypothetical protein ACREPZ_09090 [Rhodanobacteraceae bacterium]
MSWLLLPMAALTIEPAPATSAPSQAGTTTPTRSTGGQHSATTGDEAGADTLPAWRARTLVALDKRGDVDGYLGAAMLAHGRQSGKYVQDASRVAPDDPDVAWMKWWSCSSIPDCDRAAAIAHIRKLEPENAAAWIPDVKATMASGDPFKVTDALKKVASLDRFDDHTWSIGRRAGLATIALPPPPGIAPQASRTGRLLVDVESVGGLGMGGVYSTVIACSNLLFFEARLQACKVTAGLLEQSGDRQYEGIGSNLAGLLVQPEALLRPEPSSTATVGGSIAPMPENTSAQANPEVAAATARRFAYIWRTLKWRKIEFAVDEDPALARMVQDAIRSQPNESTMIATVFQQRGIPLTPPEGWEPAGAASTGK